jgi:hypothetical protein
MCAVPDEVAIPMFEAWRRTTETQTCEHATFPCSRWRQPCRPTSGTSCWRRTPRP